MSYKTILACLTTEKAAKEILPSACRLARDFGAHLIGVHTLEALVLYPGVALHYEDPRFPEFNEKIREETARIKEIFDAQTKNEEFVSEWRSLLAHSEHAGDQLNRSAYRADLVIVSRPDPEHERPHQVNSQHDLIMHSGRPVLVIPPGHGDKPIGSRVLLSWNATREAGLAARNVLPFLDGADQAYVLTVESRGRHSVKDSVEGHEVAKMLGRHGAHPEVVHTGLTEASVGRQILHEAHERRCDLVAMGAFGHSRLHNFFFGDATHFMLENGDMPVLYSS